MKRQIDNKTYLNYLLQSLNVDELKQICRGFNIKGFSRYKKSELINFILDSLSEEELEEVINQKELDIISNEINLALKKINGEDRESIVDIKIVNPENHEVELSFKGFNWEVESYLSITSKNIKDPERDCDCRVGANMGLCSHFWVGFILSLKEGYFKLNEWTLSKLPDNFEEKIKSVKISTSDTGKEQARGGAKKTLIDESSDNAVLMKFLDTSVSIYEGDISEIVERQSEFQGNVSVYYHLTLKNVKIGPRITKKSDFREEDIVNVENLKIRVSERLQTDNNLKLKDKISVNGKLEKDNFWGIMVKNIRKVQKL
ncbi:MAG: Rho termination factor N-terminal domain-containing protein [Candidatus Thorarchaeota archaeon]